MVFGRQGIRVPDPLPPHPTARTQNNNPIQTTGPGIWRKISSARQQDKDLNPRRGSKIKLGANIHSGLKGCTVRNGSNRRWRDCRTEKLHGAYLAYTRRRTREPKAGQRGGKRSGEKKPRGGNETQGRKKPRGGNPFKDNVRSCSRHPSCIVIAVLSYGMVSMYWCCWLSIASGGCSASPKEETSRNPAIGGAYGLWQARDPCARSLATSPHGQDTEQQPDSNDSRHHQCMLIIP